MSILLIVVGMKTTVLAQENEKLLTINFKNTPLTEVIDSLRRQYQLEIAFERAVIEEVTITVKFKNVNMKTAWSNILKDTGLEAIMLAEDRLVLRRAKSLKEETLQEQNLVVTSNYTFSGIVKDIETGETIPYATVWIRDAKGEKKGVAANQEGFFNFSTKNEQPDSLWASHIGYQTQGIRLENGQQEITLKSKISYLEEIEITNAPTELVALNGVSGQARVNPREIAKVPQIGQQDIFRSLQMLPGISIATERASALHVRGGLPDQNLVLFDGFTVYHLDHLYGFFSSINMNAVKDIQIYKGGFDAKYGGRASSIIDITGKSGNRYQPKVGVGLNLLSAELLAETPIGKNVTALVSVRRSYTDLVETSLFDKIYNYADTELPAFSNSLSNRNNRFSGDDFHFYDIHSKLTWYASDKDVISFSYYRGGDDYQQNERFVIRGVSRALTENLDESFKLGNTGAGAKWSRSWNDKLFSTLSLGYSKFEKDYLLTIESVFEDIDETRERNLSINRDNILEEKVARFDVEYQLSTKNQIDAGLFLVDNTISYEDKIIERNRTRALNNSAMQAGFYLQDTYVPMNNFSITAGLRNTWYSGTEKFYVAPRLALNWKLTEQLTFNASGGKYYQFISQAETSLPFNFNQDFWVLAGSNGTQDDEISVLSSDHYQVGLLYQNNGFTAELAAYQRDFEGLVRADYLNVMDASSLRSQWEFNQILSGGRGEAKGIDMYVSKQWKRYTAAVSYSLANVTHQFEELNQRNEFDADHDQLHEIKFLQQLRAGNVQLSLNWLYGSGRPYSQPSEVSTVNGRTRIAYTARNNARLPSYHRLDASVSYPFSIGKTKAELGASVFNLYNRNNVDTRSFIFDRQNVYQRRANRQEPQLISIDQFLLGRSLSLFMNLNF